MIFNKVHQLLDVLTIFLIVNLLLIINVINVLVLSRYQNVCIRETGENTWLSVPISVPKQNTKTC